MGIARYIKGMNKKAMLDKVGEISKKSGKPRLVIFADMVGCGLKYGAGYLDYDLFEMYNMNGRQRATILTRNTNDRMIIKMNDPAYKHIFNNKNEFNSLFADFIKRDWLFLENDNREAAASFFARHEVFMAKPQDGKCGHGIEKITTSDYPNPFELYDHLISVGCTVLEEVIVQHEALNKLYPCSINTLRLVTMLDRESGKVAIPVAFFRIGNGGRFVDNFNSKGMAVPVDELTGTVKCNAMDKQKNLYINHPMTGTPIKGFRFPYYEEALALCRRAAHVVPEIGYVGWDVAFTPTGPVLVEGNDYPGHDIYQPPEFIPDKIGVLPKFQNAEYK